MTSGENLVHIRDLEHLRDTCSRYGRMGEDYVYCYFASNECVKHEPDPGRRFSGLALVLVDKGRVEGQIDDRRFVMEPGSVLAFGRWNSLAMANAESGGVEAHLLFISEQFLRDIDIDLNAVNMRVLLDDRPGHVVNGLPENSLGLLRDAMSGLYRVSREASTTYTRYMSRSLVQFLLYSLLHIRDTLSDRTRREGPTSRQVAYAQEFMRLLSLHHGHSRDIAFYADKLHISPKYLSHLIKEHTGKSASRWIGEFVVQEAKNMLRYSGKNVQQVAYALNFSTQSSFGKYFKHITGMSPTEYQKS